MNEDSLATFCGDFCRFAFPSNGGVIAIHVPNESKRSPRYGAKLKRQGMLAGVCDWLFMAASGTYWIELKSDTGVLSDSQKDFISRVESIGHKTALIRTPEEFVAQLKAWHLPLAIDYRNGGLVSLGGAKIATGESNYRRRPPKRPSKAALKAARGLWGP
jgi:hypothetical protein